MPYKDKHNLYAAQKRYRQRRNELFNMAMQIIGPVYTQGLSDVKAELDKVTAPSFVEIQKAVQNQGEHISEEEYKAVLEKFKTQKIEEYTKKFMVMAQKKIMEGVELKLVQETNEPEIGSMLREEVKKYLWDALVDQFTEKVKSKMVER